MTVWSVPLGIDFVIVMAPLSPFWLCFAGAGWRVIIHSCVSIATDSLRLSDQSELCLGTVLRAEVMCLWCGECRGDRVQF